MGTPFVKSTRTGYVLGMGTPRVHPGIYFIFKKNWVRLGTAQVRLGTAGTAWVRGLLKLSCFWNIFFFKLETPILPLSFCDSYSYSLSSTPLPTLTHHHSSPSLHRWQQHSSGGGGAQDIAAWRAVSRNAAAAAMHKHETRQ